MKFLDKLKQAAKDKLVVRWHVQYGWNKDDAKYCLEFTSAPMTQKKFEGLYNKHLKKHFNKELSEINLKDEVVFPQEAITPQEQIILLGLPMPDKSVTKNHKLWSRMVTGMSYKKTPEGWVTFIQVMGLRRMP